MIDFINQEIGENLTPFILDAFSLKQCFHPYNEAFKPLERYYIKQLFLLFNKLCRSVYTYEIKAGLS